MRANILAGVCTTGLALTSYFAIMNLTWAVLSICAILVLGFIVSVFVSLKKIFEDL